MELQDKRWRGYQREAKAKKGADEDKMEEVIVMTMKMLWEASCYRD